MRQSRIARVGATQPGVLLVATGEDVRADGLGDTPRHDTPRPALALGKVRHVGQPVALVVAETLTAARDAAEAIEVEYEPLPAVTEAKDAITPAAPRAALKLTWRERCCRPSARVAANRRSLRSFT